MKLKLTASVVTGLALSSALCQAQLTSTGNGSLPTVYWGAQINNGIATAAGDALAIGDAVRIGTFNLSAEEIRAKQNDYAALNAAFTLYDTASIGLVVENQGLFPGLWSKTSVASTDALGIAGRQIYFWIFNASTPEQATEQGIFTKPTWQFLSDETIGASTTIDLSEVGLSPLKSGGLSLLNAVDPSLVNELVVGSYGLGSTPVTGAPMYNLAAVPEPASTAAVVAGLCLLGAAARRFKRSAA
jgi:hypothetical protein